MVDYGEVISYAQSIPGFPTFEEFSKNPDKYRDTLDNVMERIDNGPKQYRTNLEKTVYYFETYKCDSLEQAQRIASEEGLDLLKDFDWEPEFLPGSMNGKIICKVTIKRKLTGKLLDAKGNPLI